jgi:hypothetical protein
MATTPPTGSSADIKSYQYGSITGIDLTAPVVLNPNPLDIQRVGGKPIGSVADKWRFFYLFLQTKKIDTSLNSEQGRKDISTKLIEEFNTNKDTSNWAEFGNINPLRGANNPLTRDDIYAIQTFTKITDPNIQVDGWLGTQTAQMLYPRASIFVDITDGGLNKDPQSFIPVIWGNKRYVLKEKDDQEVSSSPQTKSPIANYLVLYDPVIHKEKLQTQNLPKNWDIIGSDISVNQSATLINAKTKLVSQQKASIQNQTNLIKSL